MILPYLSSAPPEAASKGTPQAHCILTALTCSGSFVTWEIIQASGSLPNPWAFHPSVVLTEPHGPQPRRKSHYSVMSHRYMPDAVRHLQAGFRSCPKGPSWRPPLLWLLITDSYLMNVYSVVNVRSVFHLLRVNSIGKMDEIL